MKPISVATPAAGVSGPAVIATSPARAPLIAIVTSTLPPNSLDISKAPITPPAAAVFVFRKTWATAMASLAVLMANWEPPLNPNHPNQRISPPKEAIGMFEPGMAFDFPSEVYLPILGPTINTAANAAVAPQRCTTPEPAKSA